jgi:ABC-type branched-subunit amino acid transport system ATPase component/branched-subunit amino acid ABC-type transport system permease component
MSQAPTRWYELLPFIIAGLTTGSVYALAGVGLVLTYKTSGVFNFAHGALATVSAYLFYTLHVEHGMPWPIAAVVCVFVAGPVLGLVLEQITRRLSNVSLAIRVVSTVGVLLAVQAVVVIIYGTTQTRTVPQYLPATQFHIGGAVVTLGQVIIFAVGAAATAGLYVFFRVARTGVAMRAVVDDSALLAISGTSPTAVRRWAWLIGVTFASASGLLLVPFINLDSITLTFLVVAAFGAAAIGAFRSLPLTYLGGLLVGVGAALCSEYFTSGLLSGLSASLPFVVLFVVLLVSPRRWLAERTVLVQRDRAEWTAPWQVQGSFGLVLLVILCLVPGFAGIHLADYSQFLAMTILFLSLGLLVRSSGQVSLCHVTFMAIGVCAFAQLAVNHHWPWFLALLVAGAIAMPVGALLAIPAIRLSGLYLALATFGFGILMQYMFYTENFMFGSTGLGVQVPMPDFPALGLDGSDKSFYYLCLIVTVLVTGVVIMISRSRLGRLSRALADSPRGLATTGTSINVTRVLVFCLSAFLAAIAGVLAAGAIGQANGDSYPPIQSLVYFALVIITLGGAPWYALTAAAGLMIVPSYLTSANTSNWLQVIFGLTAIGYAMAPPHLRGMPPALAQRIDRLVRRRPAGAKPSLASPRLAAGGLALVAARPRPAARGPRVTGGSLQARDIRVRFGGLVAVDGVSVEAPPGRITGLIGPNGAGKTTMFNACSGLITPSRGQVSISDHSVSRRGPAARARLGLGRTFQQMELFDSLTVRENVELGAEGGNAGPNPARHLTSAPRTRRLVRDRASEAIARCDLTDLADRTAGSLSTGQRRLVELARCLAGPFRILLLDEPSSGLDRAETVRFGEILQQAVAERGIGILLVEHDMALVTDICDYVYVLDFGKPIFQGNPAEVMSSPVVKAAYLGDDEVERAAAAAAGPNQEVSP